MRTPLSGAISVALALLLTAFNGASIADSRARGADRPKSPLVIGHRGAAGYLPEHTLEGYALAIERGADYIEPDLVVTKDGHLIARHEPNITGTTDVATRPEFANRKHLKKDAKPVIVDGVVEEGWFAFDFTLAEIKTLRAIQQAPEERSTQFDGKFQIPTLDEVIKLAKRKTRETGRTIGVYPETKHPTFHAQRGLALEDRLLGVLTRHGWNHRGAPVFIQSFETANLKYLRSKTQVKLVQLVDADDIAVDGKITFAAPFDKPYDWVVSGRAGLFEDLLTPSGLAEVRTYADGIGPWKVYLQSTKCKAVAPNGKCADTNGDGAVNDMDREWTAPSDVIERAHELGLLVHTWTFRNEPRRLASNYGGRPVDEYMHFYELGVDGVFSDFPDTAVTARALHRLANGKSSAQCRSGEDHDCD
ncbi:MAG: glycerophosphodiester phosphodiesterase [Burkholderiaceae bacterium]